LHTVQPVPAPTSTKKEANNKQSDGGRNQKLILLRRGNAISGLPIIIGINQLPKTPTLRRHFITFHTAYEREITTYGHPPEGVIHNDPRGVFRGRFGKLCGGPR
jgi:hypothetical protein